MDVLNLSLPLFGLVFLGWLAGRWKNIPESGLAWMQFYIVYVALPALFFQIFRHTPIEQLNNLKYITATTGSTLFIFVLAQHYGVYVQRSSSIIILGTVLAAFSVTALLYAIKAGWI